MLTQYVLKTQFPDPWTFSCTSTRRSNRGRFPHNDSEALDPPIFPRLDYQLPDLRTFVGRLNYVSRPSLSAIRQPISADFLGDRVLVHHLFEIAY